MSSSSNAGSTAAAEKLVFTPVKDIPGVVAGARAAFNSGRTKPMAWRVAQLKAIKRMVEENTDEICDALTRDLRRPYFEGFLAEVSRSRRARRERRTRARGKGRRVGVSSSPRRAACLLG
jgi:acyl-CoA reductase-like NAD-dependent aldehyde dehydrogenase